MSKYEEENNKEKERLGSVGVKYDHGKYRVSLIPTEFIVGVAKVMTLGAEKYTDDNWKLGMDWKRVYDAAQRHLNSWLSGESNDPETGLSHLYHAGCCIAFLSWYEVHRPDLDNREHTDKKRLDEARKGSTTEKGTTGIEGLNLFRAIELVKKESPERYKQLMAIHFPESIEKSE